MITVTPLHATSHGGQGVVNYLLESVTDGVGDARLATDASRYYAEAGTPPGRWVGGGLTGLSDESIVSGSQVSPDQLRELIAEGKDPGTEELLGAKFGKPLYKKGYLQDRIDWLDEEHPDLDPQAREVRVAQITKEVEAMKPRKPVHGFDFTFAPPKSFSTLWGLADPGLREQLANVHHEAIAEIVGVLERDIIRTRTGKTGVIQEEVTGVVAAAFDHWDSRAGDPHFHTHLVISNRVQTASDGKWRTIDSRTVHKSAVALSEQYDNLLMDKVSTVLGYDWAVSRQGVTLKNRRWEIMGIPPELIKEFSRRDNQIEAQLDPNRAAQERGRYRKQNRAWRETRTDKVNRSLADLTGDWLERAKQFVGETGTQDFAQFVRRASKKLKVDESQKRSVPVTAADILSDSERMRTLTNTVLENLAEARSTWNEWNIRAEIERTTREYTLTSHSERELLRDALVEEVKAGSVKIDTNTLGYTPGRFTRADGTSKFDTVHAGVFTSSHILEAEKRLSELAGETSGPSIEFEYSFNALNDWRHEEGYGLSPDQAVAAHDIITSGRNLDVMVGPAGAGKTTALAGVKETWEQVYGDGSVIGIAPSAAASQVLAESLDIPTDNLAKWVSTIAYLEGEAASDPTFKFPKKWQFQDNQLIIVDEASMAGTVALDFLVSRANAAGAKVLLVGDHAQLSAVGAGGMFAKICADRGKVPELEEVRRFKNDWEKAASLNLRTGHHSSVDAYEEAGRLHSGNQEEVLDQVYEAWLTDTLAGKHSLMIAADNQTARDLSARARAELIERGVVKADVTVELRDGNFASPGDIVTTRENNRDLKLGGDDWVKNGDMWKVLKVRKGALVVEHTDTRKLITLPKSYVDENVELGYSITAHRSQGQTVDTAHAVLTESMNREVAYVALTRAKEANHAYLVTENYLEADHNHGEQGNQYTTRELFRLIIDRPQEALTATDTKRQLAEQKRSFAQLAAEYESLAAVADRDRWADIITSSATDSRIEQITGKEVFADLVSQLRRTEVTHSGTSDILAHAINQVPSELLDDPAALVSHVGKVMHAWKANTPADRKRTGQRYVAGLVPVATKTGLDPEMSRALLDRERLMAARLHELRAQLKAEKPEWLSKLPQPANKTQGTRYTVALHAVLAYRDKWGVTAPDRILGDKPTDDFTQRADYERVVGLVHGIKLRSKPAAAQQSPHTLVRHAVQRGQARSL